MGFGTQITGGLYGDMHEKKRTEIAKFMALWLPSNRTQYGIITLLKSQMLSKIIYIMLSLPTL